MRAELGDEHTYDFVEGTIPWLKAPDLGPLFSDDDDYFSYFDPSDTLSLQRAILDLRRYIQVEGPFDGIIAFSQGATLASTLLLAEHGKLGSDQEENHSSAFKCAIFLAAGYAWSFDALRNNKWARVDENSGLRIRIPTAHVWAHNDHLGPDVGTTVAALCVPDTRYTYTHDERHTVPGRRSPEKLNATLKIVRRVIWEGSLATEY
ncbi:hypothetical protein AOL_s00043g824 [Orbilia oligospora ATCC 24927]|uniref:Serine hydrolase domain-containing protein n=1 Tax=Arthrobotrys oligospora (strain ATCC 24927 / CBS 115.81 / DSM 1491) TaxID=756982 RepID=G1X550_ARTOA|nr:hypothetical protein AOL_s00043g824 [Orbilia oligospora ATCC 24927]EGX51805.1 hypothetical protein AOL_s00043g824 [Orbilia oligospora ATCC 24927]